MKLMNPHLLHTDNVGDPSAAPASCLVLGAEQ